MSVVDLLVVGVGETCKGQNPTEEELGQSSTAELPELYFFHRSRA
jgi:hypothetical protein